MDVENEQLNKIIDAFNQNNIIISELEKIDIIKDYNTYKSENENLLKYINESIEKIQANCNHDIWYHINTSKDDYEGRSYYNCRCLNCGLIFEDRTRTFKNVIFTKEKFEVVKEKYNELKKITENVNILFQLLKEKFNNN